MCTATYLPISPAGFVLTHSRDEKTSRPRALPPTTLRIGGQPVTFPKDPQGMGTWIAQSKGLTACLLNGAFVAHQPKPPYKHSRGLIVLDVFDYVSIDSFIKHYAFTGLEPFTLILAETDRLVEVRWNGKRVFITEKDPAAPHIWSSATLYTADMMRERESWFTQWQHQTKHWSVEAIRHFHKTAGDGNPHTALRMNRQHQYATVSLTTALHTATQTELVYEDLTLPTQLAPIHLLTTYRYAVA
ncbi:NRDE family protein [Spirosoma linguale]